MKKNYLNFLSVLLVLFVGFSLSSCSDDDNDNEGNKSLIVGKWKEIDEDEKNRIWVIKADGTYSGEDGDETVDKGTWNIDGNTFNFKSSIWGLGFSVEILELNKTTFTYKSKNLISSGYTTISLKRVK